MTALNYLMNAREYLDRLAERREPLINGTLALRTLLLATVADLWEKGDPAEAVLPVQIGAALDRALTVLTDEAGDDIELSVIAAGIGSAIAVTRLLLPPDCPEAAADTKAYGRDWLDHIAILANTLDNLQRERGLKARGDVLRKAVRTRMVEQANAAGSTLH